MAKSKVSGGFVKQLGWIGLQTGKSYIEDYSSNISSFIEDAKTVLNDLKQGKTKVVDSVNDIKANGGKKIADWFYDRSEATDGFDFTDNSDSDFDAGYQVGDDGEEEVDQTPSKVLDEDSMKNIAGGQINAMYRIGAKQAEASMINAASISTTIDKGVASIVTAVNNVNSSIAAIGEKLDMITKVIVSQEEQEEAANSGNTGMFNSDGRVTLGSWWNNIKNQANSGIDTVKQYLPMFLGSPVTMAKELIDDITGFRDKDLSKGIRKVTDKFGIDPDEDRFINRLAEKLKGQTINTVGNDINEGFGDFIHNFLGGNAIPKVVNDALDKIPFFGDFIKDTIAGSVGLRRNNSLEDGSSASSEYNRDTAKFDNMVRTSIVEVIPDYLKIIAKGVTGKEYNVSMAGHVTQQTKEDRKREIDNLMDYGANNGGVFSSTLSDTITSTFTSHNVRGKGYSTGSMSDGDIDKAFNEFPLDTARDQFGILAAFYFGDKLQQIAAFNNQLDDKFWDWLKQKFPEQMATATGDKDYAGKKYWMCMFYIDNVRNQLEGSKKGVISQTNYEIKNFLSNINSKAESIISSNNAAAKIANSFGRGDEYTAVTALDFAKKYKADENTRNTEEEIEKIKEEVYKKAKEEIFDKKGITDERFDELRYSHSKLDQQKLNSLKKQIDELYQSRLLTEEATIHTDMTDATKVLKGTIANVEKEFGKLSEDASQVRTKSFTDTDSVFPTGFGTNVIKLLTDIRDNTAPIRPTSSTNGNVPPVNLNNIFGGAGAKEDEESIQRDKAIDNDSIQAAQLALQAKMQNDDKLDNNELAAGQQALMGNMKDKARGSKLIQAWRKMAMANKGVDAKKEASGEQKSGGGISSLFNGGLLGLIKTGASTILKGIGSVIVKFVARPLLNFMLKGFKSGMNDITSGIKTLFGFGEENKEAAKTEAVTVTIPNWLEKIFNFFDGKDKKDEAIRIANEQKEAEKEKKKQEAEEKKVKKEYDKLQGMSEEQRQKMIEQYERNANDETKSERVRQRAQERLNTIHAAQNFDNSRYEQQQEQQRHENTKALLTRYRDDETKSEEFRNRARDRLRTLNAQDFGNRFGDELKRAQEQQAQVLQNITNTLKTKFPTFSKVFSKLSKAAKKARKAIGSTFTRVVKSAGKALKGILHPVKSIGEAFKMAGKGIKEGFSKLKEGLAQGKENIKAATEQYKRLSAANGGGFKGGAIALAAAAGAGFNKIKDKITSRRNETEEEKQARKEKNKESLSKFGGKLNAVLKILVGIGKIVMTAVMSMAAVKTLITSIKNVFQKSMKKMEPAVTKIVKIIQPLVTKIGESVSQLAKGLSKVVDGMQNVFKVLVNSIGRVLDSLMTALTPVMEAIIEFATPLQALIEGLMPVVEILLDVGGSVMTSIVDIATGLLTGLMPAIENIICPALEVAAGAIQYIAGGLESVIGILEFGLGGIIKAVGALAEFFTKDKTLSDTGKGLMDAGLDAMEGGVAQSERGKQTIKDALIGNPKTEESTVTEEADDTPSYDSKLPTLNSPNGAAIDTVGSGDETPTTPSNVSELPDVESHSDGSIYGQIGEMIGSVGALLTKIIEPLDETIAPTLKGTWQVYQEPMLLAMNKMYKDIMKPGLELLSKISGKQIEIASDVLIPTMATQKVDLKNDLEEAVTQQKMTQGVIQTVGGAILATQGLQLAAAGQPGAGNMVYQTASGFSAQGMTTTTEGIQQHVNVNSKLLTGKYFNLSQLYPDDPYEGYSIKEQSTESTPEEEETKTEEPVSQVTEQPIPQVVTNTSGYREFIARGASGSGPSQGSYGSYLNMGQRGCGPVALADAANRRGGHVNAGSLASSMYSSGTYSTSSGTSVGGFLDTARSMGMGYQVGGVSAGSLRRASANNPVTLVGSGSGFGTRSGNTHYVNVVGTDSNGGAYVSNPLSGRVERRSANDLVSGSVLGLYGSGDIGSIPDGLFGIYGSGDITQKEFNQYWPGFLRNHNMSSTTLGSNTALSVLELPVNKKWYDAFHDYVNDQKALQQENANIEYHKSHASSYGITSSSATEKVVHVWTEADAKSFYKNIPNNSKPYIDNWYYLENPNTLTTINKAFGADINTGVGNAAKWLAYKMSLSGFKAGSTWAKCGDWIISSYQNALRSNSSGSSIVAANISGQDLARKANKKYAADKIKQSTANLNANKSTQASTTITIGEATTWLNRLKTCSSTSGIYEKIKEVYSKYNKKDQQDRQSGSSGYTLNMWWYKNACLAWDEIYINTARDQYTNTFAKWYASLKDKISASANDNAIFMTQKGRYWKSVGETIANGKDYMYEDLETTEESETTDYTSSSYESAGATQQSFSAYTNPGGFTGYISTDAKYTPDTSSVESPKTGSSFKDRFKQMMSGLTSIWTNIMSIFSLDDKSEAEQAVEDAEEDKKERSIREKIGNEEYEQYEDVAWKAYMEANPQSQGESDETYQIRLKNGWTDKVKQKWMNKVASEQANMIDALRYNSLSDVQEGVGSTIYGGYNQETGMWEGGAWSAMGSTVSGGANSNVSSYNDPLAGKFVSDGGVVMWTDKYTPEITSTNITEDGGASQSKSPIHEFFYKTAGLQGGENPEYAFSNNSNWYTKRDNPNTEGVGSSGEDHKGVDIKTYPKDFMVAGKSELHAITNGKITDVRFAGKGNPDSPYNTKGDGGWGNSVEFTDAAGYRHRYAHMRDNPTVKVGDTVNGGDLLGVIGTTGDSTGEHLHYQIDSPDGSSHVNPLTYFKYHQPTMAASQGQLDLSNEYLAYGANTFNKSYASKDYTNYLSEAQKAGMSPAKTAQVLGMQLWEDGVRKLTGEKSITKIVGETRSQGGATQLAYGLMNWIPPKGYSRGQDCYEHGGTLAEQLQYIMKAYYAGPQSTSDYAKIIESEYNVSKDAAKQVLGHDYALHPGDYWGDIADTDLLESSAHYLANALQPTVNGVNQASDPKTMGKYVGSMGAAYNYILEKGYGNVSSYQGNGQTTGATTDQSQIGQGTGAGNENWTDTEGNKRTIWSYLVNTLGFSKEGAAGAMGNMYAESHYSPYALLNHETDDYSIEYANKVNSTGKFPTNDPYGIVQWLGDRRTKLLTHAKSSNASIADLPMQLSFLGNELNGGYKSVNDGMKAATDVKSASDLWQQKFEVCGAATDKRRSAAQEAYNQFKNATDLDISSYQMNAQQQAAVADLNNTLWINTLNKVIHETDLEGLHTYSNSNTNITLDGQRLSGRPDCTGMFKYAIDYLGYDTGTIQSHTLVNAASANEHPIKKDGQPSEDFTAIKYDSVGKENLRPGDIVVRPGHGEVAYGMVGSELRGWNFGFDDDIERTQKAAARMLNGETVQSVMEGDNIPVFRNTSYSYVVRPSGQLAVPVAGAASTTGGAAGGLTGGIGMNVGKFNTAMNSTSGRYGQTGLYRNSYSKGSSFGNYAFGAMGGYANFVNPSTVGVSTSSFAGNSGATSTMISGVGTLPAGPGINVQGITKTAQARSSEIPGMSNSGLVEQQLSVPSDQKERYRDRPGKPTKVTWHTWSGNTGKNDAQVLMDWWKSPRTCSVNYAITNDGKISQEIDEGRGPFTSSSESNDKQAVTFEIENSKNNDEPEWEISDAAMQSAINLTYDIAKRNGISSFNYTGTPEKKGYDGDGVSGNWTYHRSFSDKSCPGDYIYDRTNDILNVINGALANSGTTAQNSSLAQSISNVTAAGDVPIPDIDVSKIAKYTNDETDVENGLYDITDNANESIQPMTNNIVVNKIDYDQDDMMDRLLNNTFNVRAVQVEALLTTIIDKMDQLATGKKETVDMRIPTTQQSLFPNDEIPKQVQRLAQG